ncbi:MAG TPA: LysR family transcriptional regulator [Polyangiaceae bacterium]
MDLDHLRYFQAIAACRSLTRAAKVLRVSQPTLTIAMRRLEESLGTTLLLRDRSGVRLTATGEELLRHAGELLALVERTEQQIKGLERDDVGSFILGCHESLGAYFLPGFLAEFLPAFPQIELSLWNDVSTAVHQAVIDRTVHFGLVVNPSPHPDLVIVELFDDFVDLFVIADTPRSSAPASRRHGTREAEGDLATARRRIAEGPMIFATRFAQWRILLDRLAAEGLVPGRRLACGSHELVKSLALAGIGVAVLPRRIAAYGHEGKLRRLHPGLPFYEDRICLIYRADAHRTRAAVRVKDALVQYGKGLAGR